MTVSHSGSTDKTPKFPLNPGSKGWRIEPRDVIEILKVLVLIWVAWLLPSKYWRRVSLMIASFWAVLRSRNFKKARRSISSVLGRCEVEMSTTDIVLACIGGEIQDRLAILKSYCPAGWRPTVVLSGAEHVDAGLARGCGVVLWVNDCVGSRLFAKVALHQAGFSVSHLSAPTHGFVGSEVGVRWLNRFWTQVEDRYLAERVGLQSTNSRPALERLKVKLENNEVISITVGPWARRCLVFPFFSGYVRLPTGPVALARSADATLLPVFTKWLKDGRVEVIVEEPLSLSNEADDNAMSATVGQLADRLQAYVREYPGHWRGWFIRQHFE